MSIFDEKIKTVWGNSKKAGSLTFGRDDMFTIDEKFRYFKEPFSDHLGNYTISFVYSQSGYSDKRNINNVRDRFIDGLKEEFFKELRHIERRICRGLYERDLLALESAVRDLHIELY